MSHTYYQNIYHLIWSTNQRKPLIPPDLKQRIFEFLGGTFKVAGCMPIEIGGMADHIHALVAIPPKFAVSDIVRDAKISSNKWCRSEVSNSRDFSWQEGFGSFTVSKSQIENVRHYILNQEEHHKKKTFKEEFIRLLELHEIEFEEKYLWL